MSAIETVWVNVRHLITRIRLNDVSLTISLLFFSSSLLPRSLFISLRYEFEGTSRSYSVKDQNKMINLGDISSHTLAGYSGWIDCNIGVVTFVAALIYFCCFSSSLHFLEVESAFFNSSNWAWDTNMPDYDTMNTWRSEFTLVRQPTYLNSKIDFRSRKEERHVGTKMVLR